MGNKWTSQYPQRLRQAAETQLLARPVMAPAIRPAEELLHELQVHQIELEMQNETLRQAQFALEESRDRYIDLYDFAPVGYITLSSKMMITAINLTGAALLGEMRSKLLQRRFARFIALEDSDRWYQSFQRVAWDGDKQSCEVRLQRADGTPFHAQLDCLRSDKAGTESVVRIALTDNSERRRTQEELRIAAIAFESRQSMMVTDAAGRIMRVNQAFTALTGYSAEDALGKTPALLRSGRQDKTFYQTMWRMLTQEKHWQGEIWNRHKNGKIYAEWLSISAVCTPQGNITHYVGTLSDITQNSEAEAEIHRLAYYDPLTQLPNRRLLEDRLGQALVATTRSGNCGAILFLDLDNFKIVNDMCGHDGGDLLLTELAQRLLTCVRAGDTVARLGGDEFVLVLENLSSELDAAAAQAKQLGDKVRQSVAQPFLIKGQAHQCPVSIGIRLFRDNEVAVEHLLRHADLALYQSKNSGRNTLCFFDPAMQLLQDRRNALVNDLRQASPLAQLRIYYQPQIDHRRGVIGAEGLLRWLHPTRGLIAPGEFIQLAEETGIILAIGHWVLLTACAQIKAWEDSAYTRDLKLAINVSARQFRQSTFVVEVQHVLQQTGADPGHLKIEITESLVLNDIADTLEKMQALKTLGISCSLDDFGTGYSSLSYLTRLPLDEIKIDKAFIIKLPASHSDAIIAQTIINMARDLELNIIAEGVETEAQREFLELHGCHACQGNLFSRPLPLDEFEHFVAHWPSHTPPPASDLSSPAPRH